MKKDRPMNHFSVGIEDMLLEKALNMILPSSTRRKNRSLYFFVWVQMVLVGANKNSIKIIGIETENDAQAILSMTPRIRIHNDQPPALWSQ
jgi:pyruvate-ferredoxin/flavodoxin oxidoreductase